MTFYRFFKTTKYSKNLYKISIVSISIKPIAYYFLFIQFSPRCIEQHDD